jgi:hypothetical protein
MDEEINEPELVLPIICNHCGKEINLSMTFALLPPKDEKQYDPTEENTIS